VVIAARRVRSPRDDANNSATTLLLSTKTSTTLLAMGSDVSVIEAAEGFTSQATLCAGMIDSHLAQITSRDVTVWQNVTGSPVATWTASEDIVAAGISGTSVVIGMRGGQVALLSLTADELQSR